jgi:hypothetical protein
METISMSDKKETRISKAIRLTFSYKGNDVKLVSKNKVEKILPPSNPSLNSKNLVGLWYEISNDKQNVLYQKNLSDLIQTDVEVFSNDAKESIRRQKLSRMEGTFSILVPDLPDAQNFSLFSSPSENEAISSQKSSKQIFQMKLNEEGQKEQ